MPAIPGGHPAGDALRRVVQNDSPCRFVNLGFGSSLPPKFPNKKGLEPVVRGLFLFGNLVGARGFEPPTTCTPCRYATRLRYAPFGRCI